MTGPHLQHDKAKLGKEWQYLHMEQLIATLQHAGDLHVGMAPGEEATSQHDQATMSVWPT